MQKPSLIHLSLIAAAALGAASPCYAALTVDDYCDVTKTAVPGVKEMRPLADGISYAAISDDGKRIEVYSYQTGKMVSTLFDIDAVKGEVKIKDFDGYTLSSNEKKILLWTNKKQIYRHSFTAEYYVYDVVRNTMKRVSADGPQRGAVISHDGRFVAYQRGNNVFISNLDYGTDQAITKDGKVNEIIYGTPDWGYEEEFGMENSLQFSADDNVLVFMRWDESKVPVYSFDNYRSYCDDEPLGDPYPEAYSYKYSLPGYNNSVVCVQAYDLNNKTTKTMDLPMVETDYIPHLSFAGDGSTLMVMVLNRDQNNLRLFSVNPGSTVSKLIYTDTSTAWLAPDTYKMVDYAKDSFVIASERSGYRHLYQYSYTGNLTRTISKGDFNITAYYGRDKAGNIYVQCTKRGAVNRNIARIDSKGAISLLNDVDGYESGSFSKNCQYYVRNYSNVTTPNQYSICSTDGKKRTVITDNAEYAARYASAPKMELTTVKNAQGVDMAAYMIKPTDFDATKQYPLITYQYNGPDSQQVLNRWVMDGNFYLASEGYVVACMDGRGTGNRDRQWAYSVYKHLGEYETADQVAGARNLMQLPYIDSDKVGCFGWSYGGYMTLMELTAPDTPFKAGVSMAPVTDWRFYDSIYTERYMLTPQQNESGYDIASALDRTQRLNSRLLIMSGTSDDNVHFYNTLKYTSKINSEGKVFDMMAFTGFEHSLRMCNARAQLYRKVLDFLNTHVNK